jgi:hypothetical protein
VGDGPPRPQLCEFIWDYWALPDKFHFFQGRKIKEQTGKEQICEIQSELSARRVNVSEGIVQSVLAGIEFWGIVQPRPERLRTEETRRVRVKVTRPHVRKVAGRFVANAGPAHKAKRLRTGKAAMTCFPAKQISRSSI